MARPTKNAKKVIYVFCEGESEIEYTKFLKQKFADVVSFRKIEKVKFEDVENKFKKEPKYRDYGSEIDELWFFFDIDEEQKDREKWNDRLGSIKRLRKLRKKPCTKVRLLMTTGCIEYWLYLHFEKTRPSLETSVEKEKILKKLQEKEKNYRKGDTQSICNIAEHYSDAIKNGRWCIEQLENDAPPTDRSEDGMNEWLYRNTKSFSNVHEAILFLETLQVNK